MASTDTPKDADPAVDPKAASAEQPVSATENVEVVPVLGSDASSTQAPDSPQVKGAAVTGPLGDPAAQAAPAVFVPAEAMRVHLTSGEMLRVAHSADELKDMLGGSGYVEMTNPESDQPRFVNVAHVVYFE